MSEVTFTEEDIGILEKADILVGISKKKPMIPPARKFLGICVYGTKTGNNGDIVGEIITLSNKEDLAKVAKITEKTELNFVGKIKLWNVATLTAAHVKEMQRYGETLIVLSGKSSEIKTNSSSLNFGDMVVWLTETVGTTTHESLVKMENRGVFLDMEKKGKALWTISNFLARPSNFPVTSELTSSTFKGVIIKETADSLDTAGYSYYFKTSDACWAKGFAISGGQASAEYMRRAISHEIRTVIAATVHAGLSFNEDGLNRIEGLINDTIESNRYVQERISVTVPRPSAAERAEGLLSGIVIVIKIQQEIKRIELVLEG